MNSQLKQALYLFFTNFKSALYRLLAEDGKGDRIFPFPFPYFHAQCPSGVLSTEW